MFPSMRLIIFVIWEMFPVASLIPTMLSTFFTSDATVSGRMLQPVRLGTL